MSYARGLPGGILKLRIHRYIIWTMIDDLKHLKNGKIIRFYAQMKLHIKALPFTSRKGNPNARVTLAGGSKIGLPYHSGQPYVFKMAEKGRILIGTSILLSMLPVIHALIAYEQVSGRASRL